MCVASLETMVTPPMYGTVLWLLTLFSTYHVAWNDVGAVSVQTALCCVAHCYDICDSMFISAIIFSLDIHFTVNTEDNGSIRIETCRL